MKRWKKVISILIFIFLLLVVIGYRFSAINAAERNPFVTQDDRLVKKYNIDGSELFVFRNDKKKQYQTVLSEKFGLLYHSNSSTYLPYHSDSLQTMGGMSFSSDKNSFTFLCIKSFDNEVAYIEAGILPNVQRKEVNNGEIVSFLFPFSKSIHLLNATAFDKKGNRLYYFGYPKEKASIDDKELKWYEIKGE